MWRMKTTKTRLQDDVCQMEEVTLDCALDHRPIIGPKKDKSEANKGHITGGNPLTRPSLAATTPRCQQVYYNVSLHAAKPVSLNSGCFCGIVRGDRLSN